MSPCCACELSVARTWQGTPLEADPHAVVGLSLTPTVAVVTVEAQMKGDPPPPTPPGRTPGLWAHEVVELFLLGDDDRYLELELGPQGHYLVLTFAGCRKLLRDDFELSFSPRIEGNRWHGRVMLPADWLPAGPLRGNAYAIFGTPPHRQYLAASPVPGPRPDFHRLRCFVPLDIVR